ncbi:MAG: hypothetical protein ACRDD7_01455 [Peptostreptococcaceae bacterium]
MVKEEYDSTLKAIRDKAGVTSYTIWRDRIKLWLKNILLCMGLWCIYNGIVHMGWYMTFISLLSFTIIEVVIWTTKHIYYGIKLKKKYPN